MKKPSKNLFAAMFSSKKFKHGGTLVILIVIVVAVAVLLNVGVSLLESRYDLSVDMSKNQMFTLGAQTKKTVGAVDQPIKIYSLMRTGNEVVYIEQLLENYRKLAPDYISVENVDPVANATFSKQFSDYDLAVNSLIVTNEDASKVRVVDYYDMFEVAYDQSSGSSYVKSFKGEQKVTNAINFVLADSVANAYFLTGHGEIALSSYSQVSEYLEGENLNVEEIAGTQLDKLQQGDLLVITSPSVDLTEDERLKLKDFLDNDGYLLYMTDPNPAVGELPNFESLVGIYGVTFNHDIVVEQDENHYYSYPTYLVPNIGTHSSVAGIAQNSMAVVMPNAQSFTLPDIPRATISVEPILTTTADAYGKTDLNAASMDYDASMDLQGPLNVGLVIREVDADANDAGTKIVLLGNSSFVTNASAYTMSGNVDLMMGSVKWMLGQSDTVSIIGKSLLGNSLRFTTANQMTFFTILVIVIIPVLVLAAGLVVWLRRRHL